MLNFFEVLVLDRCEPSSASPPSVLAFFDPSGTIPYEAEGGDDDDDDGGGDACTYMHIFVNMVCLRQVFHLCSTDLPDEPT